MKQKKSLQEVLFNLLLFFFCRGTSGEELECWREEAVFKEVREREAGGELVFIIHTSSRVAGQQIAADERRALLFFLLSVIPFLGLSLCSQSFSFTLPSLFASSSSFHTKLYVVIYCCAVLCSVLIIPICSVFPPCAFPLRLVSLLVFAFAFAFGVCCLFQGKAL